LLVSSRSIASAPPNTEEWFEYAALRLIVDDHAGNEAFLRLARSRAGDTIDAFVAYVLARMCTVTARPVVDPGQVIRWAESAVARDRGGASFFALGMAHYRVGHFDEAVRWFMKDKSAMSPGTPVPFLRTDVCSRRDLAVGAEKRPSRSRNGDIGSSTALVAPFDKSSFIGLLPHRQAGARRSPGFDDFGVRPCVGTDPFEQVEDQCVQGCVHIASQVSNARRNEVSGAYRHRGACFLG
jgi:hypothetical protein